MKYSGSSNLNKHKKMLTFNGNEGVTEEVKKTENVVKLSHNIINCVENKGPSVRKDSEQTEPR